jgi:hypothetical protein
MPMRLLPKQEVSILQASKKRAEIDEGLKLARRVDSLREIAATEEASLALFREKTLKAISADIKELETERSGVQSEVISLRNEIAEGTKVLDVRESALKQAELALEGHKTAFGERLNGIKIVVFELKKLSELANSYYHKIISAVSLVDEVKKQTAASYAEAKEYLTQTIHTHDTVVALEAKVVADLKTRDIAVASQERDLMIRAEHLDTKERNLRAKELQLIDREQTLEREFTRLKKKYGT